MGVLHSSDDASRGVVDVLLIGLQIDAVDVKDAETLEASAGLDLQDRQVVVRLTGRFVFARLGLEDT